ncbi:CNH domain-containing protein [Chytriomyces cf. hyalinus JEL632]|nr:CNH domain-containing protein [Chytriomyces cf. hyalinus JEL632]
MLSETAQPQATATPQFRDAYDAASEEAKHAELWKTFLNSLPNKRMYHIDEIINNQTNFVAELRETEQMYLLPLSNPASRILEEDLRDNFLWSVFGPLPDLIEVATRLLEDLKGTQLAITATIESSFYEGQDGQDLLIGLADKFDVGRIFSKHLQNFGSFLFYSSSTEDMQALIRTELQRNPRFKAFHEEQLKAPKARSLTDSLTAILKRFSDYKVNLEKVLEKTADHNMDRIEMKEAIAAIARLATEMNENAKKLGDQRKLDYISSTLEPNASSLVLKLKDPKREHIYQTPVEFVTRKNRGQKIELHLLDNYLFMIIRIGSENPDDEVVNQDHLGGTPIIHPVSSVKKYMKAVFRKPIHIDNVRVSLIRPSNNRGGEIMGHGGTPTANDNLSFYIKDMANTETDVTGTSHVVYHLRGAVESIREAWQKKIDTQQKKRAAVSPLGLINLMPPVPHLSSITIASDRMLVADQHAVYMGMKESAFRFTHLMQNDALGLNDTEPITQIDVVEKYDLLIVLAGTTLYEFCLSAVLQRNKGKHHYNQRKIAKPVSFFKIGVCDDKLLICAVGDTGLRWQMKLFDPNPALMKASFFGMAAKMHLHKDIFIPTAVTSIDFLKLRVVIGTSRGFEMVHMTRVGADANSPLLDNLDPNLRRKGILGREDLKPCAMFRTRETNFLLCFQDEAFYVNKNGKLLLGLPEFNWRGLRPTKFVYFAPYIIAISDYIIDVFDSLSGDLVQSIVAENVKLLHVLVEKNVMYVSRDGGQPGVWMIQLKHSEVKKVTLENLSTMTSTRRRTVSASTENGPPQERRSGTPRRTSRVRSRSPSKRGDASLMNNAALNKPQAAANATPKLTKRGTRTKSAKRDILAPFQSLRHPLTTSSLHAIAFEKPPFTIKELRDAVPSDCFIHSTTKSLVYVVTDLAMAGGLFTLASLYIDQVFGDTAPLVSTALWAVYSVAQGVVCTGIWVLAHECGHGGFSASPLLNNIVGWILHSALLVPYFSWKISHSKHHKGCAHMDKDQVFVPRLRSDFPARMRDSHHSEIEEHGLKEEIEGDLFENAPIVDLYRLCRQQLFGWHAYILGNASGQRYFSWASHFHTTSPIFSQSQATEVVLSDIGVGLTLSLLAYFSYTYGFLTVFKLYVAPYLWVNHWLVMITFLQHTDVRVPHYRGDEWNFLRGALSTVDRDFGLLNLFFHHITDTHVAHHLFSSMPFYNAQRATQAISAKLGKYYLHDDSPIFLSLWRSYRACRFVEDEGNVLFYKR